MKTFLLLIGFLVVLGGVWMFVQSQMEIASEDAMHEPQTGEIVEQSGKETSPDTVIYYCDNERTIHAAFHSFTESETTEGAAGGPPRPEGSVAVSLDGADAVTLSQTLSASGVRYANADESLVFWNKGDEALIMRDNEMDLTYTNCKAVQ